MTPFQMEIIKLLADFDMCATKVAKHLHYHRNAIRYHVGLIKKNTGLNPTKFYDLCELLELIKEREVKPK